MSKWQKTSNITTSLDQLQKLLLRLKRLEAADQIKRAQVLFDFYQNEIVKNGK